MLAVLCWSRIFPGTELLGKLSMASGDLLVCYIGINGDKPFILREVRSTKGVLVRLVNKYTR